MISRFILHFVFVIHRREKMLARARESRIHEYTKKNLDAGVRRHDENQQQLVQ
jgi:hypothetical protein